MTQMQKVVDPSAPQRSRRAERASLNRPNPEAERIIARWNGIRRLNAGEILPTVGWTIFKANSIRINKSDVSSRAIEMRHFLPSQPIITVQYQSPRGIHTIVGLQTNLDRFTFEAVLCSLSEKGIRESADPKAALDRCRELENKMRVNVTEGGMYLLLEGSKERNEILFYLSDSTGTVVRDLHFRMLYPAAATA